MLFVAPLLYADDPPYVSDASVRTWGPYCGVSAVYAAARLEGLGDVYEYRRMRKQFIDTPDGSSMRSLEEAARSLGLSADGVVSMSVGDLRSYGGKAILHVKSDTDSGVYDHWVFCAGFDGDSFIVVSPPHEPVRIRADEMRLYWDGRAILIGDATRTAVVGWQLWLVALGVASIGVVVGATIAVGRARRDVESIRLQHPRQVAAHCGLLLLVGSSLSAGYHVIDGYIAHPELRRQIEAARYYAFAPELAIDDIAPMLEDGAVLIDARALSDYAAGHIAGAINVPATITDANLMDFLSRYGKSQEFVIYCQSSGCPLSDKLGGRLWELGYESTFVVPEGYEAYQQMEAQ